MCLLKKKKIKKRLRENDKLMIKNVVNTLKKKNHIELVVQFQL